MIVRALSFYKTTVGKKAMVAVTGIILFGFLIGHMLGNLQIFMGQQVFDHYAEFLKSKPGLLYVARLVLLSALVLHIACIVQLFLRNRRSRAIGYRKYKPIIAGIPSRSMFITGPAILVFLVYHLLHFTVGTFHSTAPNFNHEAVYQNVVTDFSHPAIAVIYIVAMFVIGFHLLHGVWSLFQTLGLNHPRYNAWRKVLSAVVATVLFVGFVLIPLAVLTGLVS